MIKRDILQIFMTFFGLSVAVLIVIVGLFIVFSHRVTVLDAWPKEIRTIFGVFVISYGLFRSVIIYQKSKRTRNVDDEPEY